MITSMLVVSSVKPRLLYPLLDPGTALTLLNPSILQPAFNFTQCFSGDSQGPGETASRGWGWYLYEEEEKYIQALSEELRWAGTVRLVDLPHQVTEVVDRVGGCSRVGFEPPGCLHDGGPSVGFRPGETVAEPHCVLVHQ